MKYRDVKAGALLVSQDRRGARELWLLAEVRGTEGEFEFGAMDATLVRVRTARTYRVELYFSNGVALVINAGRRVFTIEFDLLYDVAPSRRSERRR